MLQASAVRTASQCAGRDHPSPFPRCALPAAQFSGGSAGQHRRQPAHVTAGRRGRFQLRRGQRSLAQRSSAVAAGARQDLPPAGSTGRNILVAVDSSEDSRYALRWAVEEMYCPGDVIHVAHCVAYMAVPGGMYAVPDSRLAMINVDHLLASEEQYLMAEEQAVQAMCAQAFQGHQAAHVVDMLREEPMGSGDRGRIAEALCRKAEELQATAVVIASHAKSRLSEFLLGSVASHCTQHCTRPVLVLHAPQKQQPQLLEGLLSKLSNVAATALVGEHAQQPAAAGEQHGDAAAAAAPAVAPAGGTCSRGRSIVLAVDDSDASERACAWALHNLYRAGDTFHLLRIIPTLPYRASYGGPALDGMVFYMDPPTDAFKSAAEQCVQHRFEPKLKDARVKYEVDIIVEATDESVGGVGEAICQKADDLQAAAVVLGSHMSGGLVQVILGSVATYVAHHCKRPVAVLR